MRYTCPHTQHRYCVCVSAKCQRIKIEISRGLKLKSRYVYLFLSLQCSVLCVSQAGKAQSQPEEVEGAFLPA